MNNKFWLFPELDNLEMLHTTKVVSSSARHSHETLAIGLIEDGSAILNHKGNNYVTSIGSVIVINPDDVHMAYSETLIGYSLRMSYISLNVFQQVSSEVTKMAQTLPLFKKPVIKDERLYQQVYSLHTILEYTPYQLQKENHLFQTLTFLIKYYTENCYLELKTPTAPHQAISQVKDYINENYIENISINQLSQLVHISPFHLSRVFSAETGLPPHLYLTQVRVLRAKSLLSKGYSIAQVAQTVGFTHQSHLNRHFKRMVGVTPKQYQKGSKNVQDSLELTV